MMNIPEWVDRRTAEWCAEVCDHISAQYLRQGQVDKMSAATVCAVNLRSAMTLARPQLPVRVT
jgi:hypothetical protein